MLNIFNSARNSDNQTGEIITTAASPIQQVSVPGQAPFSLKSLPVDAAVKIEVPKLTDFPEWQAAMKKRGDLQAELRDLEIRRDALIASNRTGHDALGEAAEAFLDGDIGSIYDPDEMRRLQGRILTVERARKLHEERIRKLESELKVLASQEARPLIGDVVKETARLALEFYKSSRSLDAIRDRLVIGQCLSGSTLRIPAADVPGYFPTYHAIENFLKDCIDAGYVTREELESNGGLQQ